MPSRFNLRKLIDTPSLHQDWGQVQDERRTSWTELFTDLFYVLASAKVTELLAARPD
jgi:low temperature requirement protein LtrA